MIQKKQSRNSQAPRIQPQRTEPDWISRLIHIATELKLNEDPEFAETVKKVALKGNQSIAKKLVQRLSSQYYENQLKPNHFRSMETDSLNGEFLLGYTEDGKPFGLDREDLVRHVLISGQSGSGKTELLKSLFLQTRENGDS